jgi:methyl-accepting chemotaxis protein
MPRKRERLFLFLLPAILLVPIGGFLAFLIVSGWHAGNAEAAVSDRLKASLILVGRELEDAVQLQKAGTERLSQSPMVRVWMKYEGRRRTPSSKMHSASGLEEIANYGKLLPGTKVYAASEARREVWEGESPIGKVSGGSPADAWYFSALQSDGVRMLADSRIIRTTSRVMNGARILGVVSCVGDVSSLAASGFAEASGRGLMVALTDGEGQIVRLEGTDDPNARSIQELYPSSARETVRATMDALHRSDQIAFFTHSTPKGPVRTAAVRTQTPGWFLFVSSGFAPALPAGWIAILESIFAAVLLLLLLALGFILGGRRRVTETVLAAHEKREKEAREGMSSISAALRRAESAAERLSSTAERIAGETAGAQQAASEAITRLEETEESHARMRGMFEQQSAFIEKLTHSVEAAGSRARGAQEAAAELQTAAARAEEELSQVIVSAEVASHAVGKLDAGIGALAENAERARMLSLNASLEAARASESGRQLANVADEIRGIAENMLERAQSISNALGEAAEGMEKTAHASEAAGKVVHGASARATEASRAIASSIDAAAEAAGEAAAAKAMEKPSAVVSSDRARSAIAGLARLTGRIADLARESAALAKRAGAETKAAAETAERLAANPSDSAANRG